MASKKKAKGHLLSLWVTDDQEDAIKELFEKNKWQWQQKGNFSLHIQYHMIQCYTLAFIYVQLATICSSGDSSSNGDRKNE